MSNYYNGIDIEREKEQLLIDKCYAWWDSLSKEEQYNLMQDWYPNEFEEDDDADKFFGDMPNNKQLWIWKRENKYTEEDMQAKVDNIGDMECHKRMVEGDDIDV